MVSAPGSASPAPSSKTETPSLFKNALTEALIAGAVALALFTPLVGLRTVQMPGQLVIEQRWLPVLILVAICTFGRFVLRLYWGHRHTTNIGKKWFRRAGGRPFAWPSEDVQTKLSRLAFPALFCLSIALPFLFVHYGGIQARYFLDISILILTYIMLGWGLNIVVGLAGLLDLGYVAFYAVGAYSYALLAAYFDLGFWICLPLAGILAAFWGIILGFPVLRLRGDYLAIVTLAFGEIIRVVLLNWYQFTGGPDGLSGIPRPSFFGLEFTRGEGGFADVMGLDYSSLHRIIFLYYVILLLALLTNFITLKLRRMPVGRAWEAMREDEIACRSLGINITNTKLTAFAIGAMFGGFAGSFFATRQGFISPESFTFIESGIILAIVVLGGLGSQIGIVISAIVMIGGFEVFRQFEEYRMLIFGLLMVSIMVWKPRGLISSRKPSVILKERKAIHANNVAEGAG
jgi:branched-chain amino acid transport system permease protein